MSKEEVKSITQDDNLEELESATPSEDIVEDKDISEENNEEVKEANEDNEEIVNANPYMCFRVEPWDPWN